MPPFAPLISESDSASSLVATATAPAPAPITELNQHDDLVSLPADFSSMANHIPIRIARMFDVRRVLNSDTELRLSFDVPASLKPEELQVLLEQDTTVTTKSKKGEVTAIQVYNLQVSGGGTFSKAIPLNAKSIDVENIQAFVHVHTDANAITTNELEVVAPKKVLSEGDRNDSKSAAWFSSVMDALQAFVVASPDASSSSSSCTACHADTVVHDVAVSIQAASS